MRKYTKKVKFYDKNSKKELKNDNFGHYFDKNDEKSCFYNEILKKCCLGQNEEKYKNTADMYLDAHKIGNENVFYIAPGTKYTYNYYVGFSHSNDDRDINSFMELMWKKYF